MVPREGTETSLLAYRSRLSQREGACLGGFLGHHKLCGVPGSAFPQVGPSRLGAEQGRGPCVQGWAQPDFWRVRCIPAWLDFSALCFPCLSDACEADESASLSLCSFLSTICPPAPAPAQPVAETGGPHPPSPPSLPSCPWG